MDNGVGPYTPETEDWAAIEAAAIKEGSVVVYSNSSKIEKLLEPWVSCIQRSNLEGGDTDDIAVKMCSRATGRECGWGCLVQQRRAPSLR